MLERIIELLLSLAVAAAGGIGIATTTGAPDGVGPDVNSVAAKVAWAKQQAAARSAGPDVATLVEEEDAESGTATALEALKRVMESAPEAATDGLNQAWESVSSGGSEAPETSADDAADAAPIDVPAGPPAEVPAGPPDGAPPADPGRP